MKNSYLLGIIAMVSLTMFTVISHISTDENSVLVAGSMQQSEPVLVIDAGHGGFDGGAVSGNGTYEKDINLSISKRTQDLAAFFGVQTKLTRENEDALDYDASKSVRENKVADIKARETIVNGVPNPIFLSIHLNKFGESQYHGAQVFFSANNVESQTLAELLQSSLISGVDPENHRVTKKAESTIYLMKKLSCPAVIVECGFLSNPEEEQKLLDENYHTQLAISIIAGYLSYAADA